MFDTQLRQALAGPLDTAARHLDRAWITPDRLTLAGLFLGLASAVLAASQWWRVALAAWLLSRLMDGLDSPLSRLRAAAGGRHSPARGFLDITGATIARQINAETGTVSAAPYIQGVTQRASSHSRNQTSLGVGYAGTACQSCSTVKPADTAIVAG